MHSSPNPPGRPHDFRPSARLPRALLLLPLIFFAGSACAQSAPKNAALDARDAHGLTPLVAAASHGDAAQVKALLAAGASANATSADGRTPLIAAAESGKIETVEMLVAAGANLDWSQRGAGTALNVAENTGQAQIAALLLHAGAHSTGKSVGDTVCVRPWASDGFCGTVRSFSLRAVEIEVTKIVGCAGGCEARAECSAARLVGGGSGIQAGDHVAVPSWCLTQTGVKP
jgi:ankyrin repeat protein